MNAFEMHYTQHDLAVLLGWSVCTVIRRIKDEAFGREVLLDGQTYLVPHSGLEVWRQRHKVFKDVDDLTPAAQFLRVQVHPVAARNTGELRRKCVARGLSGKFRAVQTHGMEAKNAA